MSRKEREEPEGEAGEGDGPFPCGDEPPDEGPDRPEPPPPSPPLDGPASRFFAALEASLGSLQERAQRLIQRVNEGRRDDQGLVSGLREGLLLKVR
ncbi:hypothetical protein AV530_017686 [Patagioenas fasciata monilis]|uniref:Uncharacterized protein n=1 Tax=Patagioenas fasciata monilis TaxID=372326 RepID=A0A1V4JVG4_PATFA|nr:hypothetical protein AV530_017686 [Patagioenas fasciata monilis]